MRLVMRHGGEINQCMSWIVRLQFCFDGGLFLIDGCGFYFILFLFYIFLQWVRSVSSECLAMIHWWVRMLSMSVWLRFGERGRWLRSCFCSGRLFLWWLGVILMDGCGYVFLFYFILFYFIFSCSGLWLP